MDIGVLMSPKFTLTMLTMTKQLMVPRQDLHGAPKHYTYNDKTIHGDPRRYKDKTIHGAPAQKLHKFTMTKQSMVTQITIISKGYNEKIMHGTPICYAYSGG